MMAVPKNVSWSNSSYDFGVNVSVEQHEQRHIFRIKDKQMYCFCFIVNHGKEIDFQITVKKLISSNYFFCFKFGEFHRMHRRNWGMIEGSHQLLLCQKNLTEK
jgi:hypothetical protein